MIYIFRKTAEASCRSTTTSNQSAALTIYAGSTTTNERNRVTEGTVESAFLEELPAIEEATTEVGYYLSGDEEAPSMDCLDEFDLKTFLAGKKRQTKSARATNKTIAKLRMLDKDFNFSANT